MAHSRNRKIQPRVHDLRAFCLGVPSGKSITAIEHWSLSSDVLPHFTSKRCGDFLQKVPSGNLT